MKNIWTLSFLLGLGLLLTQCSDPCDDIDCNNGTCDDGTCICEDGYTGTNCELEIRAPFVGTFEGDLDCPDAPIDLGAAGFGGLTVVTQADENNIFGIVITTPSIPFNIFSTGTIDGNTLTLTPTSSEIDVSNIPNVPLETLPITTTGSGELDGDNIVMTVNIIIPLLGNISCTSVLTRI